MSNVLEFRPASAGGPVQAHSSNVCGEVIIFPGVRYERTSDASAPSPRPTRSGGRNSRRGAKSR